MAAQEQSPTSSELQKVKEEVEEYPEDGDGDGDENDQLTVSQFLRSRNPPLDSSPKIIFDNPQRSEHFKREREVVDNFSDDFKARSRVMERAEEIRASLAPKFPSFIKLMLRSHVTKGFWLGLPSEFCKSHLPKHDETIILEDESGKKYKTNFLVNKTGLSGGWKGFSVAQKLLEHDVAVFHLVKPCKFKVYVVRANDVDVADALNLLNSDTCTEEIDFRAYVGKNSGTGKKGETKHPRLEDNLHSSGAEVSKLSGSTADFKNFNIVVHGLAIDSDLSNHVRRKYYDLCCTRKSNLHNHLLKFTNSKIAAGIISEMTNIADAIRASKLSTPPNDFAIWDRTLEAFELLGMDVGFLRDRLNRLMGLSSELTEGSKRYGEARIERDRVQEEICDLVTKIVKLKQDRSRLDDKMKALKENDQRNEVLFLGEANAPWP